MEKLKIRGNDKRQTKGEVEKKKKTFEKIWGGKPSLEEVKNSQLENRLKGNKQEERIKFEMFSVGKVNKEES